MAKSVIFFFATELLSKKKPFSCRSSPPRTIEPGKTRLFLIRSKTVLDVFAPDQYSYNTRVLRYGSIRKSSERPRYMQRRPEGRVYRDVCLGSCAKYPMKLRTFLFFIAFFRRRFACYKLTSKKKKKDGEIKTFSSRTPRKTSAPVSRVHVRPAHHYLYTLSANYNRNNKILFSHPFLHIPSLVLPRTLITT